MDDEEKGIREIIRTHTKKGISLSKIAVMLEKQKFDPDKIHRAILAAGDEPEKKKFHEVLDGTLKPLVIFAGVYLVFLLIVFLFVTGLLEATFKVGMSFWSGLVLFLILYIMGLIGFIANSILFRFVAFLFVKDMRVNSLKNAFYLMLISFAASMYMGLVIFVSISANNLLTFLLILFAITFIFQLGLISFMYRISTVKALLLTIVFSIAQNVLSWVIAFFVWLLVFAFLGVMFLSAPAL